MLDHYVALIKFKDPSSTTYVVLPSLRSRSGRSLADSLGESSGAAQPVPYRIAADSEPAIEPPTNNKGCEARKTLDLYGTSIANLLNTAVPMRIVHSEAKQDSSREEKQSQRTPEVMNRDGSVTTSMHLSTNIAAPHELEYVAHEGLAPQRFFETLPDNINVMPHSRLLEQNHVRVKAEPESISSVIRVRRQAVRRSPYPTRLKSHLSDPSKDQSSSSTTNTSYSQNTLSSESCFGYTARDYRQHKVKSKNAFTSWYTYHTSGLLDNPPDLPPYHTGLQHNVILLNIDETQRVKIGDGQFSKLLKYCIRMWIWNAPLSRWERIFLGERRSVGTGYDLCMNLCSRGNVIHPQWVTPKRMSRIFHTLR
ncbi:hypothetical protein C8J55DRAFT_564140 [Lentinula edodes]|uniref:Uncharacterized protein n=1 Tax=Lentinula lateritia TaxID=40482 RepID=A0A9W8ZYS3_9AGAR|nr:hypothetical protein C8J55DRAFT_564140 [Lentinula edodes]